MGAESDAERSEDDPEGERPATGHAGAAAGDVAAEEAPPRADPPTDAAEVAGPRGEVAAPRDEAADLRDALAVATREATEAGRRADELAAVARRQQGFVDELHAENRALHDGEIREALAPAVRGLARVADDVQRLRAAATPEGAAASAEDLAYLDDRLAELLHDLGAFLVAPEPGDAFDPQQHQGVGSTPTGDPIAHRTVAEVRRRGLRRDDGRVLRPADVVVHRFVPMDDGDPRTTTTDDEERDDR